MKKWPVLSIAALIVLGAVVVTVLRYEGPRQVYAATASCREVSATVSPSATPTRFDRLAARNLIDREAYEAADSPAAPAREALGASFAALDEANAGIVEAGRRLAKAKIHAPISGQVRAIRVAVGDIPAPGGTNALMVLASAGPGDAGLNVGEAVAPVAGVGQPRRRALMVPLEAVRYVEGEVTKGAVFVVDGGRARCAQSRPAWLTDPMSRSCGAWNGTMRS